MSKIIFLKDHTDRMGIHYKKGSIREFKHFLSTYRAELVQAGIIRIAHPVQGTKRDDDQPANLGESDQDPDQDPGLDKMLEIDQKWQAINDGVELIKKATAGDGRKAIKPKDKK